MSVKYEYTGRFDNSSGTVTMAINYTNIATAPGGSTTLENGLLPDVSFSDITKLEDCPFTRTASIIEGMKAIYVPQDFSALNLKSPLDSNNTVVPQRLFILITGGK